MKRLFPLVATLFAVALPASADTLTVAVAANVKYAFDDIRAAFKKETGHEVTPVYNSSGKLAAQILNGAPFDVFLSADMDYPEKLHKQGVALDAPIVYAYGALVLWTMKDVDLTQWQSVLASPAIRKIAVANPKTAPYGRETLKVLTAFNLGEVLKNKLVFGESIAQTNQYIHSQAADAGFTAKSVVLSQEMKGKGKWVEIPASAYTPIAQGVVVLKRQQHSLEAAQSFQEFVRSPVARRIFERYGYLLP